MQHSPGDAFRNETRSDFFLNKSFLAANGLGWLSVSEKTFWFRRAAQHKPFRRRQRTFLSGGG
jgi:hypothetical protein